MNVLERRKSVTKIRTESMTRKLSVVKICKINLWRVINANQMLYLNQTDIN